ncbi:hypothetical protein HMPREF0580_1243 [Mobiluncus mulieris ATCC 35239]|uniref:Uncharacterized protein n=2 Tax=Mobiluncus mulieris TaxID=2052 RepID=E0QQS8_9ACTO|nr:DUF6541 family protein [Mobiluncus mulieris]EFM45921.1 hypothetical protein HMPREF0580_1243 [Mobiluncus mulieris ATCC 35239]MCU9970981.1 hypothetical protein [Mobiluncus mulieris]MCU9975266.1 hypothetical protein [Mobiluncus mulieris]MCU9993283.1 hypothetical protein [Mobiluncus mulieris]MCV0013658.1 hypothetical protein [Mobiluncus mulieris]
MLSLFAAIAAVTGFLILPGALLAVCARFRPLASLALGAPITAGLLAVLAQVFVWAHIPWTRIPVGVTLVFLVVLVCVLSWWFRAYRPRVAHARNTATTPDVSGGHFSSTSEGVGLFGAAEMAPDETASLKTKASSKASVVMAPSGCIPTKPFLAVTLAAFVLAGSTQLVPFIQTIPVVFAPAQSFDAMFHYSSIRTIADSGAAGWRGSLDALYPGKTGVYYPNQWAAILALFLPLVSPTLISNAILMSLTLFVWPLGVALLAEQVWGRRSLAIPLAVLFSPMPLVFPYFLGVLQALYPYVLAVMWWPAGLWVVLRGADVLAIRRLAHSSISLNGVSVPQSALLSDATAGSALVGVNQRSWGRLVLGVLVLVAVVHAHPSAFGFIAIAAFMALVNLVLNRLLSPWWLVFIAIVAVCGGIAVPWGLNRLGVSARAGLAGDSIEIWRSVASMLGLCQISSEPWWVLLSFGLAVLLGLVWHALTARDWRFLGIFVAISLLVLATKLPLGPISTLTALWYGAYDRVGTGLAVLLPVFAAGFVARLAMLVARRVSKPAWRLLSAVVAGLLLVGFTSGMYLPQLLADRRGLTQIAFVPGSQFHPPWVSIAEYQALVELRLPPHANLIGDPSSGAGLAYAAGGTQLFIKQLNPTGFSPVQKYLAQHFREIHENPRICQLVRREKITHFYDDATGVGASEKFTYPGLHDVDVSTGFTEVARVDRARVYRIDACR